MPYSLEDKRTSTFQNFARPFQTAEDIEVKSRDRQIDCTIACSSDRMHVFLLFVSVKTEVEQNVKIDTYQYMF
jgi:lipocalin